MKSDSTNMRGALFGNIVLYLAEHCILRIYSLGNRRRRKPLASKSRRRRTEGRRSAELVVVLPSIRRRRQPSKHVGRIPSKRHARTHLRLGCGCRTSPSFLVGYCPPRGLVLTASLRIEALINKGEFSSDYLIHETPQILLRNTQWEGEAPRTLQRRNPAHFTELCAAHPLVSWELVIEVLRYLSCLCSLSQLRLESASRTM